MERVRNWLIGMAAGTAVLILSQGLCSGDNTMPRALDPAEHLALMKLAAAVRQSDFSKLEQLVQERPDWHCKPQVQANMAFALLAKKDYAGCMSLSQQLIDASQNGDPDLAAWAKYYAIRCTINEKKFPDAARSCFDLITSYGKLQDLMPVLNSLRNLGMLISYGRLSRAAVQQASKEFADSEVIFLMASCTKKAERGDLEGANWFLQALADRLPSGDKRIAIAATSLMMSAGYFFDRNPGRYADKLLECQTILSQLEQSCPEERWLITRSKLTLASAIMRGRRDLPKAERYLQDVVDEGTVTDLLPEAYALLANTLYAERRYDEAALAANAVVRLYPYSTWVDFAAFLHAECVYNTGNKPGAITLLDQVMNQYPESGWAQIARTTKEVVWR